MAAQKNFEVDQNTNFNFVIEYKDDSGVPIELTGASAKMQVRDTKGGSKLAISLTSPSNGITIDGLLGKISIEMNPAQTNSLFYPKSSYDIMITDSNGKKKKIIEGYLTLSRSVTI